MLAKANELVRRAPDANTKAATDKEVGELKKRLDEFEAAKERMVKVSSKANAGKCIPELELQIGSVMQGS